LAELINTTHAQCDIADQFGIDPAEVTRIVKESRSAGIKLHPKRKRDRVNRRAG
jgi:DNA-binding MarR family transcriptional regulator